MAEQVHGHGPQDERGGPARSRRRVRPIAPDATAWLFALAGTSVLHGGLVFAAVLVPDRRAQASDGTSTELVAVAVVPTPAPPPPQPEPEPQRIEEPPPPPLPLRPRADAPDPVAPPEPATEPELPGEPVSSEAAGQALTSENAEGFSLVSGDGERYGGGASSRQGGRRSAGSGSGDSLEATPRPMAPRPSKPEPPPIVSRPWPENGSWNMCRFPEAAERAGLDDGSLALIVSVNERGRPLSVRVVSEYPPGYGFAESARRCAMKRRYHPGRDAAGNRVAADTESFTVRMLRDP